MPDLIFSRPRRGRDGLPLSLCISTERKAHGRVRRLPRLAGWIAGVLIPSLSASALANGFLEEAPWRFRTPDERLVEATIADLIERKKNGFFDGFSQTTNIERQINCNQTTSAVGNSGNATHAASGIAPAGVIDGSLGAASTGNAGELSNSIDGNAQFGGPLNGSTSGSTGGAGTNSPFDVLVSDAAVGGLSAGGPQQVQDQSNDGTTITSSVNDSDITGTVGNIDASGAAIDNVLNLDQNNDNTDISASINDSSACTFQGGS